MRPHLHFRAQALAIMAGILTLAATASAEEWSFLGARYQAMGGAGVAVVDDAHAAYWNPGALAFTESVDVQVPFGVSAAAEGGVLEDIDRVSDFIDRSNFDDILDDISDGEPLSEADLRDALELAAEGLALLDVDRQGFLASLETGLLIRAQRFSLTGISLGYAGVNPLFDLSRLSFSTDASGAVEQLENIVGTGNDRSDELSDEGRELARDIKKIFQRFTDTGNEKFQAQELVFQAEEAGLDIENDTVRGIIESIAEDTADFGSGDLSINDSGAFVQGLATQEVALSYGHPFFDQVGVGGSIKYMHGITTFNFIRYDDVDSADDVIDEVFDGSRTEHSDSWGVDLGILYRPLPWLRAGIVGRNLNSPSFDIDVPRELRRLQNSAGDEFNLDPQVRGGVAVDIFPIWTVAADIDLTENDSQNLDRYESRLFSLGTEVRIPVWTAQLALRGGTYLNTVSSQDNHPVITAGLGLRVWHLAFDLSGGVSVDQTRVDATGRDEKIPTRANVAAMLSWHQAF